MVWIKIDTMYYTYSIHYKFRGQDRKADVHQYDSFRFVYLLEDDLLKEFGGQIEFGNGGAMTDSRQPSRPDASELYTALARQFRPILQPV
jgi:hypothetical protein